MKITINVSITICNHAKLSRTKMNWAIATCSLKLVITAKAKTKLLASRAQAKQA